MTLLVATGATGIAVLLNVGVGVGECVDDGGGDSLIPPNHQISTTIIRPIKIARNPNHPSIYA